MTTAEKYVAAAYAVLLVALLVYVAIISLKLARFDRDLAELERLARGRIPPEQESFEREEAHHG